MYETDIKEAIYKCSKCGLCQCVCPIFIATKNELYLPRGRFITLNNYFNNNTTLSKKFIDDLDVCLNCNACKNFCPSNIDSEQIFTFFKSKYKKSLIPFSLRYKLILIFHSIKRFFVKNQLYKVNIKKINLNISEKRAQVVYFQGCFNRYINPSDKNAAINLLKMNGYNIIKKIDKCCGLMYWSDGDLVNYKKNAENIIKLIPKNTEYVVTSCDSCYKSLSKILANTEFKVKRLDGLIEFNFDKNNILYYKPFSRNTNNIKLNIINKKGFCSFMENYFLIKHNKLAKKIIDTVKFNQEEFNEKILLTSCNLSKWGLIEYFKMKNLNVKIQTLAEYIFSNYSNH